MQAIAGFIDYDANGKPFMGLILEEQGMRVQVFLARKEDAQNRAQVISNELHKLAKELIKTPDKLVAAQGDIDAFVRKVPGK